MKERLFADMFQVMFGRDGSRWLEVGGTLPKVWSTIHQDLSRDEKSVVRYCRGFSQYPRRLRKSIIQTEGLKKLRRNMQVLVESGTSLVRVRRIQEEVHDWIQNAGIPEEERKKTDCCFVAVDADPEEIATYLTAVFHCVIGLS